MEPARKLSIKRILLAAVATVAQNGSRLARALAVPGAIFVGLTLVPAPDPETSGAIAIGMLQGLISIVLHTLLAINIHRIVLLGADAVPEWGVLNWSRRETQFSLYVVGSGLVVMLMTPLALATVPVGPFLLMGAVFVFGSAVALMFPAIAAEHELDLMSAWQLTQGNLGALIVCIWLVPFALAVPVLLLTQVAWLLPVAAALQLVILTITVTALSLAYTELRRPATAGGA
ncbi:MAG: hypothetical protein AAF529_16475 [Pseudomonadota bacterium]